MIRHIKFAYLLIGIIIGIIGVYFIKPSEKVVYKYPTPQNSGLITYKDKNGVCYKYNVKELECDKNVARLKDYPLTN
jgi:hypothetical protein